MPAPSGRFAARASARALRPGSKWSSRPSSRSRGCRAARDQCVRPRRAAGVLRPMTMRPSSRGAIAAVRPQADGGVERLRAVVEQVERPDVEGAAGQIDARRRGRFDVHASIIMAWTYHVAALTSAVTLGQLPIVGFAGTRLPAELRALAREFDLGGVILFARNVEAPEQVAELARRTRRRWRCETAAVGQRGPGRRPRRAARSAVHRVAADDHAGPARRRARSRGGSRGRWPRSCTPSASRSTTRRCSTCYTNPKNPVIGDRALAERRRRRGARWARDHPGAAGRRALPPAASTSPGTAIPAPTRTSSCRSSSTRPTASEPWSSSRSGRPSRRAWPRS